MCMGTIAYVHSPAQRGGDMHLVSLQMCTRRRRRNHFAFWARLHLFVFTAVQWVNLSNFLLQYTRCSRVYFWFEREGLVLYGTVHACLGTVACTPPADPDHGDHLLKQARGSSTGTVRATIFCLIRLPLQASRGQPVGVWACHRCCEVQIKACHRCCKFHVITVTVCEWRSRSRRVFDCAQSMRFFCCSSFAFVSSLLEAIDREEDGRKINSYGEPTEKDWSWFFLNTSLDKRPTHPVAATQD